jgi:RNA polymerase Rpb1, domain 3
VTGLILRDTTLTIGIETKALLGEQVPAIIKPVELWTGKQLFSVLVRPNLRCRIFLNIAVKERQYTSGEHMCPRDGFVCFVNSELVSGRLGKGVLGGNKNGLFAALNNQYGPKSAGVLPSGLPQTHSRPRLFIPRMIHICQVCRFTTADHWASTG